MGSVDFVGVHGGIIGRNGTDAGHQPGALDHPMVTPIGWAATGARRVKDIHPPNQPVLRGTRSLSDLRFNTPLSS